MKKLKKSLLSFMSFAIAIMCLATPISASEGNETSSSPSTTTEKGGIQTRESDWPDYNYGNWKEVAAHPEKHTRVLECIGVVLDELGIDVAATVVVKELLKKTVIQSFGISAFLHFSRCLLA